MKKMKYDVFISYRRTSFESANLIATRLRAEGYRVFFDMETMRSGLFNEQLYSVIESCKDFVIILSPDALDRCNEEGDWVRNEVLHALKTKRNIVPVMLNGFQWPLPMPDGMEELAWYQGVPASQDFFDLSMKRLQSYLKSRNHSVLRRSLRWSGGIIAALLVIYLVMSLGLRSLAGPACKIVTEHLTMQACIAEFLLEDNLKLVDEWERYTPQDKEAMLMTMDLVLKNTEEYRNLYSTSPLELSSWHRFLATVAGADTFTLRAADDFLESLFETQISDVEYIRYQMDKDVIYPSEREDAGSVLGMFTHMVNAFYYSYLQVINTLPKSAHEPYYKIAKDFDKMPKSGLGLKDKDYEMLMMREFELADVEMEGMRNIAEMTEDEVFRQEMKLDSLNNAIFSQYKDAVAYNAVRASDSIWMNWGKICSIAGFLEVSVSYEMEEAEDDEYDVNPVPPEVVYTDLSKMLDDFASLYPSSALYAKSVKAFYREVSELKRPFKGVLISSFAEGQSHDFYQLGDIIVSWNGVEVGTYNELVAASKMKDGDGKVRILRLDGDSFKELHVSIPGNEGIVGFNNLRLGDE